MMFVKEAGRVLVCVMVGSEESLPFDNGFSVSL